MNNNELSIFIATHKQFDDSIFPNKSIYTILSTDSNFKSSNHNVIYISNTFTKYWKEQYSEGAHMHYLYTHSNLINDYIVFYHYRRYFINFINNENKIIELINKYKCIVVEPEQSFWGTKGKLLNNINEALHVNFDENSINIIKNIIEIDYPEIFPVYLYYISSNKFYNRNIFAMKKNDFLEMCIFVFDILNKYKLYNDKENYCIFGTYRFYAYLLEHLTCLFYLYKFGTNLYTERLNRACWA